MQVETHLRNIKESLAVIDECIEKGIVERQRNIGFNASAACTDMLELFLHKKNLLDSGFLIKHQWLKSRRQTEEKLPFNFPKKQEILTKIRKIEEKRNLLCYGRQQPVELLQEVIKTLNEIKELFREAGLNEI